MMQIQNISSIFVKNYRTKLIGIFLIAILFNYETFNTLIFKNENKDFKGKIR